MFLTFVICHQDRSMSMRMSTKMQITGRHHLNIYYIVFILRYTSVLTFEKNAQTVSFWTPRVSKNELVLTCILHELTPSDDSLRKQNEGVLSPARQSVDEWGPPVGTTVQNNTGFSHSRRAHSRKKSPGTAVFFFWSRSRERRQLNTCCASTVLTRVRMIIPNIIVFRDFRLFGLDGYSRSTVVYLPIIVQIEATFWTSKSVIVVSPKRLLRVFVSYFYSRDITIGGAFWWTTALPGKNFIRAMPDSDILFDLFSKD